MYKIIKNKKIEGPVSLLFTRSEKPKKNYNNIYKMSGSMPKIKVETEDNSAPTIKVDNPIGVEGVSLIKDDSEESDNESSVSGSTVSLKQTSVKKPESKVSSKKNKFNASDFQNLIDRGKSKPQKDLPESDEDDNSDSYSEYSDYSSGSSASGSGSSNGSEVVSKKDPKKEKQEILLKLLALEKKGVVLTKNYSMSSKLEDLKFELNLHKNNAEVEASVKLQQKILMAAVSGLEFANSKFDPIGAKLDGWSESVMDNLDDYESIFIKLHEKYKHRANLPPELQLLVSLVGSAFMFHVTKTMFSSLGANTNADIMNNLSNIIGSSNKPPEQSKQNSDKSFSGPSLNLANLLGGGKKVTIDDDAISESTVETSKEVTVNQKGKRSINL